MFSTYHMAPLLPTAARKNSPLASVTRGGHLLAASRVVTMLTVVAAHDAAQWKTQVLLASEPYCDNTMQ